MTIKIRYFDETKKEEELDFKQTIVFALGVFAKRLTEAVTVFDEARTIYISVNECLDDFMSTVERSALRAGLELSEHEEPASDCDISMSMPDKFLLEKINSLESFTNGLSRQTLDILNANRLDILEQEEDIENLNEVVSVMSDDIKDLQNDNFNMKSFLHDSNERLNKLSARIEIIERFTNMK